MALLKGSTKKRLFPNKSSSPEISSTIRLNQQFKNNAPGLGITLSGSLVVTNDSESGQGSIIFDTNSYAAIPFRQNFNTIASYEWVINVVVKPFFNDSGGVILSRLGTYFNFALGYNFGNFYFLWGDPFGTPVWVSDSFPTNTWAAVTIQRVGGFITFTVNAVSNGPYSIDDIPTANDEKVIIGAIDDTGQFAFNGIIDTIIFNVDFN